MANDEHLAILRKGVEEWNRWRHSGERPDLSDADLSDPDADLIDADANLCGGGEDELGADLMRADLRHAHLSDVPLSGANLICTDLRYAHLSGADLRGADLSVADLTGANLSGADLSKVFLIGANVCGANLSSANLSDAVLNLSDLSLTVLRGAKLKGANLGGTTFADVDLSVALGLDEVEHYAPSSLATDTLSKSRGKIPETFLRGCGLTDWEIQAAKLYDPDLSHQEINNLIYEVFDLKTTSPIVFHRVFISYGHADSTFVEKLEAGLDTKRIRYWRDVHDMKAGRMEKQIEKAIRINPLVLLVLSERSVESDWVEWEVAEARELEKKEKRDVLCPIALDDAWKSCDWPGPLRRQIMDYNILDFSDPEKFDEQFEKLVGGIVEFYPAA